MLLDELTITLSDADGHLSVETLTKALENALGMLRGIETGIVESGVEVRWEIVRARMQSPLQMTFSPRARAKGRARPAVGRKIVKACLVGIEGIEKGTSLPRYFNDEALDAARKLVKMASSEGTSLTLSSNGSDKVKLTEKAIQHIDEISSKARLYVDFSTIEGRLEVVSAHDHNSFFIWETLTNNKVECFGTDNHFREACQLLKQRVAITGRVGYRNHIPKTIHVEEPIRVLREMSDLPQPKTIGPIDITDGMASEEHVWKMRNA